MAKRITNIGTEAYQQHIVFYEGFEITIKIRFCSIVENWFMDVSYKDTFNIYGLKLTLGCLHMESSNKAFDFVVLDNSGTGLDPFRIDDFESRRTDLILLEKAEMEIIRGFSVEV